MSERHGKPRARRQNLVVKSVGDEMLVYDLARHRAHSLNLVAAAVWRQCDGTHDPATLAAVVRRSDNIPVTVEAVHYALAELGRAHLLVAPVTEARLTRRDLVKHLGTAAAVALPLVTSIGVPRAADAQSASQCVQPEVCEINTDCCPCPPPQVRFCLQGQCVCGTPV